MKLSPPYIKKLNTFKRVTIWQVDGNHIRNKIDVNFNNSGHHYNFPFIPKNEIWIDKDFSSRNEEAILAKQSVMEHELIKSGLSDDEASNKAYAYAKQERKNKVKLTEKEVYATVYVKELKKYNVNDLHVWVINGQLVRDKFYLYFTEGGHHYVYKFVPKNEIWIDDSLNPIEYDYVIFHEVLERNLMKYNKLSYDHAHDAAINYEGSIRKNKINPVPLIMNELNRKK